MYCSKNYPACQITLSDQVTHIQFHTHQIPKIERIDGEVRLYKTPEGNLYPSVTTVLSAGDHSAIDAWRAEVGAEVADKISNAASRRGSLIHLNVENTILGAPLTFNMFHRTELEMYQNLLPTIQKIEVVHCLETTLWSDKLKVAGTVDLIAKWNGKMVVLDWKTSGRYKSKDEIHGYFIQASAYAYMFWERTGVAVSDIVIAMTTQDDGVLMFEEKVKDWLPKFIELRDVYSRTS